MKSGDVKAYEIEAYFLISPRGFCRDRPVYFESVSGSGSENPVVALMALNVPVLLWLAHGWYALMPGVIVFIGGTLFSGVWHVWFESVTAHETGQGRAASVADLLHPTRNRPSSSGKRITPSRRGRFPTRIGS